VRGDTVKYAVQYLDNERATRSPGTRSAGLGFLRQRPRQLGDIGFNPMLKRKSPGRVNRGFISWRVHGTGGWGAPSVSALILIER
jgi:hypothetical protein